MSDNSASPASTGMALARAPQRSRAASPLRVVILSDALRDRNGVDAYYRDLVEHLGARVDVVELINPDSAAGNHYERLAIPMPGDHTQRLCFPNPRQLYKRVRAIAPHVIVMATPGPFGMFALFTAKRLGARLIAGFHTHLERLADLYWSRVVGGIGARYLEMCNRILFRYAQLVVVNSTQMATPARRLGARRLELVGTPIAHAFLGTPASPLAPALGHVVYAGRLSPEKNVHMVAEAAERLRHIRFTIAGDGPLAGLMRERARELDNLSYLGLLARARLVAVIDSASLLVLPSQVEAFGTIALEAMARGRLALVAKHCGIARWPALATNMFHLHDHEHLSDAIARIARIEPALRMHKAAKARTAVHALNDETLDQWLNILSDMARLRPRVPPQR